MAVRKNLAEGNSVGLVKIIKTNVAELSFVRRTSLLRVGNYADPNQNFFFRSNLIGIRPTSQRKKTGVSSPDISLKGEKNEYS